MITNNNKKIFLVPMCTNGPGPNKCIQVYEKIHEKIKPLELKDQDFSRFPVVSGSHNAHRAPRDETTSCNSNTTSECGESTQLGFGDLN